MSYDLNFVRKVDGQTWEEAYEALDAALEDDDHIGTPDSQAWGRIVAAARQVLGDVEVHDGGGWYELDHEPTGIQVNLSADSADLTVPYWYAGADAARIVEAIYRLGQAVEEHTGLTGYDPQVERPLAEVVDRPEAAVAVFDQVADSFQQRGIDSPSNG